LKAIEESEEVKKNYPNFWKFYEMLMDLNMEVFDKEEKK